MRARLVVSAAVVAAASLVLALVLALDGGSSGTSWVVVSAAPVLGCAAVGAVLCTRVPSNAIGWLFLVVALEAGVGQVCDVYAHRAGPGSLAAGVIAGVLEPLPLVFLPALLVLFPEGRLPSRRWRWAAVAWVAMVVVVAADILATPGQLSTFSSGRLPDNPLAVGGRLGATIRGAGSVSFYLLIVVGVAAAVSLVRRFRGATAQLRQQLKWFAACAALLALTIAAGPFGLWTPWNGELWVFAWELALTGVVIATGMAVLRYRLYEIDVIIRRTLVYSALVMVLAALYLGGILLIGRGLQTVTGQSSALAVTVSTLAVAAGFQPLRSRIQRIVDHRFYRAKYDASDTLEEFTARLRDQIDLAALQSEVLDVVTATVQPRHVSLWLRPHAGDRGEPG